MLLWQKPPGFPKRCGWWCGWWFSYGFSSMLRTPQRHCVWCQGRRRSAEAEIAEQVSKRGCSCKATWGITQLLPGMDAGTIQKEWFRVQLLRFQFPKVWGKGRQELRDPLADGEDTPSQTADTCMPPGLLCSIFNSVAPVKLQRKGKLWSCWQLTIITYIITSWLAWCCSWPEALKVLCKTGK